MDKNISLTKYFYNKDRNQTLVSLTSFSPARSTLWLILIIKNICICIGVLGLIWTFSVCEKPFHLVSDFYFIRFEKISQILNKKSP